MTTRRRKADKGSTYDLEFDSVGFRKYFLKLTFTETLSRTKKTDISSPVYTTGAEMAKLTKKNAAQSNNFFSRLHGFISTIRVYIINVFSINSIQRVYVFVVIYIAESALR